MEVEVENLEEDFLNQDFFRPKYKNQDLTKNADFKAWANQKKKDGEKIVKCPICGGYEVLVEKTNHTCLCCNGEYCQGCLKKIIEDEVEHDHERGCCNKFCSLLELIFDYGGSTDWHEPSLYIYMTLLFLFGTPTLFTIKYFNFFKKNYVTDTGCVHWIFTVLNLIANICYSIVYTILYTQISFIIFSPTIIYYKFIKIIVENWVYVVKHYDVGECPITELTVKGRGYGLY